MDERSLVAPEDLVDQLYDTWLARVPVVVRLGVPADQFRSLAEQEATAIRPFEAGPSFVFPLERLHFLVWTNNWDARSGQAVWWWARKALALGARLSEGPGDVVLADGTAVWCDGGPLQDVALLGDIGDCRVVHRTSIENDSLRVLEAADAPGGLATDQMAAVTHGRGPARIIAPAGSGKTRVLTARLTHVLAGWKVHARAVTAVAYNTRASEELKNRIGDLPANVRTLNSLAFALVSGTNGFPASANEGARRTVIDERRVRSILGELVDLRRRTNTDPMALWIDAISGTRLALADPAHVEASSPELEGFTAAFARYREILADRRLIDFDEQIYRAVELLLADAPFRQAAQRRCRMLLVDEFQDLTPAHLLMLRLLASPALDVFGVGDDDQVIYGYAGADPRFLVDYSKWFRGSTHHALQANYRCPPSVVAAATTLLTHNRVRVSKDIQPHPDRDARNGDLDVVYASEADMADRAVAAAREALESGGTPDQLAILTRVNVTLLPIQVLLHEEGISTTAPVGTDLLDRTGIRAALAYLRIGANPEAIGAGDIAATVRRPNRRIAKNVSDMLTSSRTSLVDIRRLAAQLEGNDGPRVAAFAEDLRAVHESASRGTAAALHAIRTRVGLSQAMDQLDSSRREADRSTHADDLAALEAVAHLHPEVETFETWLREALQRPSDPDGVRLSTIHKVKGREWDRVIVFGATDGLMPHRLATNIEEERRVFHVGITRARHHVSVIADVAAPSPFLNEMYEEWKPERRRRSRTPSRDAATVGGQRSSDAASASAGTTAPRPNEGAYTLDDKRREHPQAYAPWTAEEEGRLREEFASGLKIRGIASLHGRNTGAIRSRLKKLGLIGTG